MNELFLGVFLTGHVKAAGIPLIDVNVQNDPEANDIIATISGNIEGYEAVKRGEIYSTVSQPPDWEGITAVRVAIKLMKGEKVDKWVKTPVKPVTRDNVSNFKGIW